MAWDKTLPQGSDKIKDSDDAIRANNAAIETVLGTNITAGPTTIQGAIQGDATKGRILRKVSLAILDGTNANTLKCTMINRWNGDTIAETDNVAKNATTGHFTLNAGGTALQVENAGLSGAVLEAMGALGYLITATSIFVECRMNASDLYMEIRANATGAAQDITALVDGGGGTGHYTIEIFYITDA